MRMKKLRQYIGIIALLLVAGAVSSCVKEEGAAEPSGTVNLNLQLLGISRATYPDTDFDNKIKTLRILITDEDGNILVNGMSENLTSNTVRIMGVPRKSVRIYAFANEASMGRKFDTESLLVDIDQNDYIHNAVSGKGDGRLEPAEILARAWDADIQNTYFPITESVAKEKGLGLPMTGHLGVDNNTTYYDDGKPINLNQEGVTEYSINIYLVRSVVKVIVNLTNNTGAKIDLSQIKFGRFFSNKVYYYSHEDNNSSDIGPMPYNTGLEYKNFDVPVNLESADSNDVLVYYMYPSATDNNTDVYRYSIALDGTGDFPKNVYKEFYKTEGTRTVLWRNSIMKIKGTINPGSISVTSNISVDIEDWSDKNMDEIVFN